MEKIRAFVRATPLTFESWIAAFVALILLRTFLEQFSSYLSDRFTLIDLPSIAHYGVSYLAILATLMVILAAFAKTSAKEIFGLSIFGFIIVIIPPIIDVTISGIAGAQISYFFLSGVELITSFFSFFGWGINNGITLGIQIEIVLVMVACVYSVYSITKNWLRAFLAALAFYCLIFVIFAIPSLAMIVTGATGEPSVTFVRNIVSSGIIENSIHPNFFGNDAGLVDLGFNKIMLGLNALIAFVSTAIFFFLTEQKKFVAVVKNCRPERILHFLLLFSFGSVIAIGWNANWITILTYSLGMLAFVFAWMFSVCQNDIYDKKIDSISNPGRPLVSGYLSEQELSLVSKIFLLFSVLAAYASGPYVLFFNILFIFVYFLYSNPPLRLKRVPLLSSFLIGVACLSAVLAGFFLVNVDKSILSFPPKILLAIIIIFTLASNVRDIKDITGDRSEKIWTLPVLLGDRWSKIIIGFLVSLFMVLSPWYLDIPFSLIPSFIFALIAWKQIVRKEYEEWRFFLVYLIYMLLLILGLIIS